jgi:hypothetical protein
VELAWMWLRWQPGSALSNWFRARVGQTGGRIKKIMIVALARNTKSLKRPASRGPHSRSDDRKRRHEKGQGAPRRSHRLDRQAVRSRQAGRSDSARRRLNGKNGAISWIRWRR